MSILSRLLVSEKRSTMISVVPTGEWRSIGAAGTDAGVSVTPSTAIQSTAVLACVRLLAETLASLPLPVYTWRKDGGKELAPRHYLYSILHDEPNPEMSSFDLREVLMGHLALWGNAYCNIEFDNAGRVKYLWPLRPDRMQMRRSRETGAVEYIYQMQDSQARLLAAAEIWHLRGFGGDGLSGYSPIALARQAVGLALATEAFGARFFGNGARPGLVLEHPGKLSDEAHRRLRESWEERHQGLDHSHRVAVLEEGMKVEQIGMPPEDAQFLQTRSFQVSEIARIYRVPPHMIGDLERATFSNIEQMSIEFVEYTLRPWMERWEQSIQRTLFMPGERGAYFAEFFVDGLLRGDVQSRYSAYATARQWGWLSINDIRKLENLNPVADGDAYLQPLNMAPATNGPSPSQAGAREIDLRAVGDFEQRSKSSIARRHQLMVSYRRVYRDVAARIVRRECADLMTAARKQFTFCGRIDAEQRAQYEDWLSRFYQEHLDYIRKAWTPITQTYSDLAGTEAGDEVGIKAPDLEAFVRAYVENYSTRHAGKSESDIRKALDKAAEEGIDPLDALQAEVDDWQENRPESIAQEESVRTGNAVAKAVYLAAGIVSLRWHTFGESCPYCQHMDGKKVGILDWFLGADDPLQVEGAEGALKVGSNIGHPPLHRGCDCQIGAAV